MRVCSIARHTRSRGLSRVSRQPVVKGCTLHALGPCFHIWPFQRGSGSRLAPSSLWNQTASRWGQPGSSPDYGMCVPPLSRDSRLLDVSVLHRLSQPLLPLVDHAGSFPLNSLRTNSLTPSRALVFDTEMINFSLNLKRLNALISNKIYFTEFTQQIDIHEPPLRRLNRRIQDIEFEESWNNSQSSPVKVKGGWNGGNKITSRTIFFFTVLCLLVSTKSERAYVLAGLYLLPLMQHQDELILWSSLQDGKLRFWGVK